MVDPGYRQGLISQVSGLTRAGDTNHTGDLIAQEGSYVKTWAQMDALPGPTTFFDKFLGVIQAGAATGQETQDTTCTVYTQGQFLYPLDVPALAYYPVGTFVTVVADRTVKIDPSANVSTMIGKVSVPVKAGAIEVMFLLKSKIMG